MTVSASLRVTVASVLAIVVVLCAGGVADVVSAVVNHGADMNCSQVPSFPNATQCQATAAELPVLALPVESVALVVPSAVWAVAALAEVRSPAASATGPPVPRSPPLA